MTSIRTIDLPLFSPPKVKLIRQKSSDYRAKKNIFKGEDRATYVHTTGLWASFVQKNSHSPSQAPLYPPAPPMPGTDREEGYVLWHDRHFLRRSPPRPHWGNAIYQGSSTPTRTGGELQTPFVRPWDDLEGHEPSLKAELAETHTARRSKADWVYKANFLVSFFS